MNRYARSPLDSYNSFGVSAYAEQFIPIKDTRHLSALFDDPSINPDICLVLGGGSNILFVDDFEGCILHIKIPGITVVEESGNDIILTVGAGVIWNDLVNTCVDRQWYGIENLALIPGTVGAAPVQNIGAYGVELSDVFISAEAWNLKTGKQETFDKPQSRFGYRSSLFKATRNYLITSVTLRLSKQPNLNTSYGAINTVLAGQGIKNPTIADVRNTVVAIRQSKLPDPVQFGNAGSFFKNPVVTDALVDTLRAHYPDCPVYPVENGQSKLSAAWLIDQCGWKGKRVGPCGVYEKHALILVNYGGATGRDIYNLSNDIRSSVLDRFGIELQPEVNIIKKVIL